VVLLGKEEMKWIRKLWHGEYLRTDGDIRKGETFSAGLVPASPLWRIVHSLGRFWLAHWKWIIATILTVIGLVIAAFAL
jgi:hypothetical protein